MDVVDLKWARTIAVTAHAASAGGTPDSLLDHRVWNLRPLKVIFYLVDLRSGVIDEKPSPPNGS
jgi:hypothetical protein